MALNPHSKEALDRAQSAVSEAESSATPADPAEFQAYLEKQASRARDLMRDLMMAPPELRDIVPEEKMGKLTPHQRLFLTALLYCFGNLTYAAKASGISRFTHSKEWLGGTSISAQTYQEVYPDVYEASIDHAEAVVAQRAIWGTKEFKFNKQGNPLLHPETGEPYYEYKTSDLLLDKFMRARRPEHWKPNVEVSVDLNAYSVDWTVEELQQIAGGAEPQKVLKGRLKGQS